jgi:hypothetical protein
VHHGKVRDAHEENLIEGDAKIIDCALLERTDIPHERTHNPVKHEKVPQDAVYDLHDECPVTPVQGLRELIKGMFRFASFLQYVVKAGNGRNPRFRHAVLQRDCDEEGIRMVIVSIVSMGLIRKIVYNNAMPADKIQ